jgi:nicotinate-nucleotide adenylyltransferase
MMRQERIGIFGGTFDPVHRGHLRAAEAVRRRFALDRVLFVPANIPPHKKRGAAAPARDRVAMVELAMRGRRGLVVSPVEVEAGGTSYSIRTIRRMRAAYPRARLFFILGADAFCEIETWKSWRRVLAECVFIVITRPGFRLRDAGNVLAGPLASVVRPVRTGDNVRESWFDRFRVFLLPVPALDVSSSDVRRRIRNGRSVRGLIPRAVDVYISERGLYGRRR